MNAVTCETLKGFSNMRFIFVHQVLPTRSREWETFMNDSRLWR